MSDNKKDPVDMTHFGYQEIPAHEKTQKVADVFHAVADKYDIMNDLMSGGTHRLWKRFAISQCNLRPGEYVLDLAGGSGDLTKQASSRVGQKGVVVLADINASMLGRGRNRLMDRGILNNVDFLQANAECLPLSDNTFDCVMMGFGLRNVTDKSLALHEIFRILKPGGRAFILEFSKPLIPGLKTLYDTYSFSVLPLLGKWIAGSEESYRYLAESIRKHPDQETLKQMMEQAGFENCNFHNLTGGIVALHRGYKY